MYDTLLWRDEEGVPQPWLATSVEPSVDLLRITVRLPDTARRHDGAPVTSADVAFTFGFVGEQVIEDLTPEEAEAFLAAVLS